LQASIIHKYSGIYKNCTGRYIKPVTYKRPIWRQQQREIQQVHPGIYDPYKRKTAGSIYEVGKKWHPICSGSRQYGSRNPGRNG